MDACAGACWLGICQASEGIAKVLVLIHVVSVHCGSEAVREKLSAVTYPGRMRFAVHPVMSGLFKPIVTGVGGGGSMLQASLHGRQERSLALLRVMG